MVATGQQIRHLSALMKFAAYQEKLKENPSTTPDFTESELQSLEQIAKSEENKKHNKGD